MEHSKVQLLTRDIASRGSSRLEGNKQVVGPNNSNIHWLYRIKRNRHDTHPCQQTHIPSVHDHDTSHHNNIPIIHVFSSFPCIHLFMFHICMSLPLLFSLHGLPIQPLWLQSILIRCSTRLVFSKKCPYWMVLMPVYVETAEAFVKPLVILPATVMSLTSFIVIFSWHHRPLCSWWFTPSHDPLCPCFTLYITPTLLIAFVPPYLTRFGNIFYLWQNNVVRDLSGPLSYPI